MIGRETELARLIAALEAARSGRGALWLITGTSGAGKTLLAAELADHAQAQGMTVLHGTAHERGGPLHALWRDPLQTLGVWNPDFDAHPDRIPAAFQAALDRLPGPALLVLNDLHHADEEIETLAELLPRLGHLPLLVVGLVCDDAPCGALDELPGAEALALPPLPLDAIRRMAADMPNTDAAPDIAAIAHETGGNTFLVIEALRAGGDVSGGPAGIERRALARFSQPPADLLPLAAVAGHHLDRALLVHLVPDADLDGWLRAGVEAGVLAQIGGAWCFTHARLRNRVFDDLPEEARRELHRRVAGGLEAVYAGDPDAHAEAISGHWRRAGDVPRELPWVLRAGNYLATHRARLLWARRLLMRAEKQQADHPDPDFTAQVLVAIARVGHALGGGTLTELYVRKAVTATQDLPPESPAHARLAALYAEMTAGEPSGIDALDASDALLPGESS